MLEKLDKFAFSAPIRLDTDVYNVSPGPFKRTALIAREVSNKHCRAAALFAD
jgi:hypothetical protein